MPILEKLKKTIERLAAAPRPRGRDLARIVQKRRPILFHFDDDGETPNNPRLPLVIYRRALQMTPRFDPAAICEEVFSANGWNDSWRDGIYDFLHFHTATHEVLGIARGRANVQFGGSQGRLITLRTGDIAILPAGTGHRRVSASKNLLVVGAYPGTGKYDEPKPGEIDHRRAKNRIAHVALPRKDPVFGTKGRLFDSWKAHRR